MANLIKKLWDGFCELLYPDITRCVCCGRELQHGDLCADCEKGFLVNDGHRCAKCSKPTVSIEDYVCEDCKQYQSYYDKSFSPLLYKETVVKLIHSFKYGARRDLGVFFADFMLKEYDKIPDVDIIIPVPMWKGKYEERLYSTADELATLISEKTGKEKRSDIVEKIRDTGTQTSLSREKRAENVKCCFKVKAGAGLKGKKILIIDDVYTTGATVSELARTLKMKKVDAVYVLTAAIGLRR